MQLAGNQMDERQRQGLNATYAQSKSFPPLLAHPDSSENERAECKYLRGDCLGEGGFGITFLVTKVSTSETFAAKVVVLSENESERSRQLSEAALLSSCDSTFILGHVEHHIVDSGRVLIMITEFCNCRDLQFVMKNQPRDTKWPEEYVAYVLIQVATALHNLHYDKNMLHRDVKPKNIFTTSTNLIKLGDFGFSKELKRSARRDATSSTRDATNYTNYTRDISSTVRDNTQTVSLHYQGREVSMPHNGGKDVSSPYGYGDGRETSAVPREALGFGREASGQPPIWREETAEPEPEDERPPSPPLDGAREVSAVPRSALGFDAPQVPLGLGKDTSSGSGGTTQSSTKEDVSEPKSLGAGVAAEKDISGNRDATDRTLIALWGAGLEGEYTLCGTPGFCAPEMYVTQTYSGDGSRDPSSASRAGVQQGRGRYGLKADMWALGISIYHLINWTALSNVPLATLINNAQTGNWERPTGYSDELWTIVRGLLEVDPTQRLNTVQLLSVPYVQNGIDRFLAAQAVSINTKDGLSEEQYQKVEKELLRAKQVGAAWAAKSGNNTVVVAPTAQQLRREQPNDVEAEVMYQGVNEDGSAVLEKRVLRLKPNIGLVVEGGLNPVTFEWHEISRCTCVVQGVNCLVNCFSIEIMEEGIMSEWYHYHMASGELVRQWVELCTPFIGAAFHQQQGQ